MELTEKHNVHFYNSLQTFVSKIFLILLDQNLAFYKTLSFNFAFSIKTKKTTE